MELPKFLSMLEAAGLYLARADLLGDAHEGSSTVADHRSLSLLFKEAGFPKSFSGSHRETMLWMRKWIFISSWYMNDHETQSMWHRYAGTQASVCIESTYAELAACVPSDTWVGVVKYIA